MYRFYSSPKEKARICVVGEVENGILKVAVSRCSEKDIFFRKKGRAIAEGRLRKGKLYLERYLKDPMTSEKFIEIAHEVIEQVSKDKIVVSIT